VKNEQSSALFKNTVHIDVVVSERIYCPVIINRILEIGISAFFTTFIYSKLAV